MTHIERGELAKAFQEAADLVRRRPDSAHAHHSLGAVLRYAGLLRESANQCETTFLLDPHTRTSGLRSCAIVFFQQGDYHRAMDYIHLDAGSDFASAMSISILLRQGREQEALQIGPPHIPQWPSYDMLLACAQRRPSAEIAALAETVQPSDDPEANYLSAANLAYCGQTGAALQMLKRAIQGNYCSYPAIDSDQFFASVRAKPEFAEIRSAADRMPEEFFGRARAHAAATPIELRPEKFHRLISILRSERLEESSVSGDCERIHSLRITWEDLMAARISLGCRDVCNDSQFPAACRDPEIVRC